MTTATNTTTQSAGCSPCTPEAHQRAILESIELKVDGVLLDVFHEANTVRIKRGLPVINAAEIFQEALAMRLQEEFSS